MTANSAASRDATSVRHQLAALEPVVHGDRYHGATREQIAADLDEDYWEIASTGVIYRRDEVLDSLTVYHQESHAPLVVTDLSVLRITDDVWHCAYTLDIGGRLSLRTTLWGWLDGRWRAVFHQGTPSSAP